MEIKKIYKILISGYSFYAQYKIRSNGKCHRFELITWVWEARDCKYIELKHIEAFERILQDFHKIIMHYKYELKI